MDAPWIVQLYAKVPVSGNVSVCVPLAKSAMFAGAPGVENVTLCVTPVGLFHVTLPPLAIVIVDGLKELVGARQTVDASGVQLVAPVEPGSP